MAGKETLVFRTLNNRKFGNVVLIAGLLGLQNYSFAFYTVQQTRNKVFTKEFMHEQVHPMHMAEMGKDAVLPSFGYPDMGAGRYAKHLPYKDWYRFNCAQRVHANSVEHLSWVIPMLLCSGFFFPRFATALGSVVLVGRELYRAGYMSPDGPNSHIREAGAIPLNIAEMLITVSRRVAQ